MLIIKKLLSGVFVILGLLSSPALALTLVLSDASGNLGAVDANTGQVGYLHNTGHAYEGLAYSADGTLYGVTATEVHEIDPVTGAVTNLGTHGIANPVGMVSDNQPGVFDPNVFDIDTFLFVLDDDGNVFVINPDVTSSLFDDAELGSAITFSVVGGFAAGGPSGAWTMSIEGTHSGLGIPNGDPNFDYLTDTSLGGVAFLDQMAFDNVAVLAESASSSILYGVSGTTIFDTSTGAVISDFGGNGLGAAIGGAFATENGGPDITLPTVPLPAAIWPMAGLVGAMVWRSRRVS